MSEGRRMRTKTKKDAFQADDLELINAASERLNAETLDVLKYQVSEEDIQQEPR